MTLPYLLAMTLMQGGFESFFTLERIAYWAGIIVLGLASYYGFKGKRMEAVNKTDSLTINSQQTLINTRDRELMDTKGSLTVKTLDVERLEKELKQTQESAASMKTEYMALASLDVSQLLNFAGLKKELEMTLMREQSANAENITLRKRTIQLERQIRSLDHEPEPQEGGSHVAL